MRTRLTSLFATATLLASTMLVITAGAASADVARYQVTTATFQVTEPAGAVNQWDTVWTHSYTITINPCDNSFTGTAPAQVQTGGATEGTGETITGTLGANSISYTATRIYDGRTWTLTSALYEPFVNIAVTTPAVSWDILMKVTRPVITGTSDYKNHGQYVKAQGGGDDAAHSCIGMPITTGAFEWSTSGTIGSASLTGTDVALPQAGTYRIDVWGTWHNNSWGDVDAEYVQYQGTWYDGFDFAGYSLGEGFGDVQVNNAFVNWGAYTSTHAYSLQMSLSGTVNLAVFDGDSTATPPTKNASWYSDNTGSLSFWITYVGP